MNRSLSDWLLLRRQAIGSLVASLVAALFALLRPRRALASAPARAPETTGPRRHWGMVIDLDRCTGCGACVVACQQENNVPQLRTPYENRGAQIEWMTQLWREPEDPAGLPEVLPFPCQHCLDAPCVKACPVGATFKDEEGLTVQNWERCIGCRYCMVACPYSRRSFNWDEPQWDGNLVQLLNPDVATRPRGVVEKCTFCSHRLRAVKETAKLEGRAVRDAEVQKLPACAAVCPGGAITFGDLNDHSSAACQQGRSPRAFRLLEELGTEPSVIYLKRDRRP
jgi:molybdopterin-containing oxidoreductase family iron-sulfur binding subunit